MARFYSNENFPIPAVHALRHLGHDVLTIQETGRASQAVPDEAVLAFATQTQRILLSFNRKHFIDLHKAVESHAGIVVCTFDPDFHALAQRIHNGVEAMRDMNGQLLRINRPPGSC